MIYMTGDYSSSDERYGESCKNCFAFIEETHKDGDIFISTIAVYSGKDKETEIFRFNVGTISGDENEVFSAALQTYLDSFSLIKK